MYIEKIIVLQVDMIIERLRLLDIVNQGGIHVMLDPDHRIEDRHPINPIDINKNSL